MVDGRVAVFHHRVSPLCTIIIYTSELDLALSRGEDGSRIGGFALAILPSNQMILGFSIEDIAGCHPGCFLNSCSSPLPGP